MKHDKPVIPLTPEQVAQAEAQAAKEGFLHRTLVGLDIFANVLTGGNEDETISSRSSRAATQGKKWGIVMSKFLDIFQRDHGPKAQSGDVERAQAVIAAGRTIGESRMSPVVITPTCSFCPHPYHASGTKCGVPNPVKPCKCKAKQGWFSQLLDGVGEAIGEWKFGS
jgi:uncharacterized protein YfaQ (DUF2300 family)